ncbi:hypothetical protein [Parerythrobacter aestuarii]|uniref:hypothetical protein n=1 Tax=Parerythrobacter aestuarii TaxID=3020909 RepID=UPI0024DE04C6|nr:hypothetical protein [Parerythrobacter aestuarii]
MTDWGKAIKQATKRVGRVLSSDIALTVSQAEVVLETLQTSYHKDLTAVLAATLAEIENVELLDVIEYARSSDVHAPHENRGQVYHSDYALIDFHGIKIYLSFTYTICVKLPNLDGSDFEDIRSKFWFSAILENEFDPVGDEPLLIDCLSLIEAAADVVCRATLPIYAGAFESAVGYKVEIRPNGNITLDDLMLQIDDPSFRECLEEIRDGELRIRDDGASKSFRVLDKFFSSENAASYLHCGRSMSGNCDSIDTVVETDFDWAHGFYIETRMGETDAVSGPFELKGLGVTSSFEKPGADRLADERVVINLSHSPANTISAKRVADLGELF